ncbi:unnamed protein product, partial [Symbiodinium microadriaticum]
DYEKGQNLFWASAATPRSSRLGPDGSAPTNVVARDPVEPQHHGARHHPRTCGNHWTAARAPGASDHGQAHQP